MKIRNENGKTHTVTVMDLVRMGRKARRKLYRMWSKANGVPRNLVFNKQSDRMNFIKLNYLTFLEDIRRDSGEPMPQPSGQGSAL